MLPPIVPCSTTLLDTCYIEWSNYRTCTIGACGRTCCLQGTVVLRLRIPMSPVDLMGMYSDCEHMHVVGKWSERPLSLFRSSRLPRTVVADAHYALTRICCPTICCTSLAGRHHTCNSNLRCPMAVADWPQIHLCSNHFSVAQKVVQHHWPLDSQT